MTDESMKALQALVLAAGYPAQRRAGEGPPVVALSRDCGGLGDEVARQLAERLGVKCYDRELLDAIVRRSTLDPEIVERLDENSHRHGNRWIASLLSGDSHGVSYRRHLVRVVLGILNTGGVIVGRGAHIILAQHHAFRVRIAASHGACAERLALAKGISIEDAGREIGGVNAARAKFLWDHFGARLNDPTLFDLVINTDRLGDGAKVVDIVLFAMQRFLPGGAGRGPASDAAGAS